MSLADCPSNLKEAIDWILRVTGKDGSGGGNIPALAKAIKQVLSDAIRDAQNLPGGDRMNGDEFKKLWEGLLINLEDTTDAYTVGTNGLIGNLAEGLRKFIGYKATIVDSYHGGLITGAGIAPSNIATHRLCDAAIAFTIGVLKQVRETTVPPQLGEPLSSEHKNKIDEVIKKLHRCYGEGPQKLQDVGASISQLTTSNFSGTGIGQFVDDVRKAFNDNLKAISPYNATTVAQKVGEYLKGVLKTWVQGGASGVDGALQQLGSTLKSTTPYDPTIRTVSQKITSVDGAINTRPKQHSFLKPIFEVGKKAFIDQIKNSNKYVPTNYQPAGLLQWNTPNDTDQVQACAKIFLGCLPLIFSKLSYFYWRCHDSGGGWNKLTLYSADLKDFLFGMDYHPRYLNRNKTGQNIIQTAMTTKHFKDFSEGMNKAQTTATERASKETTAKQDLYSSATSTNQNSNPTYSEFLAGCNEKLNERIKLERSANFNDCPLSALHLLASCYFRCMQSKIDAVSSRPPSTIREMLYFLAALPYSPNYDSLNTHISNHFKSISPVSDASSDAVLMIAVADSSTNQKHNTLSAADLKYHLMSTCSFSTAFLGMIQGPGASQNTEPWLYELYCNSAFNLKYPSAAALFNAIAKYTYAVQFQLLFLYFMCSNDGNKCGWNNCTYGSETNKSSNGSPLPSHICPGFQCNNPFKCWHNGGNTNANCKHNKYTDGQSCGKGSNPSALQAFLTDRIQGMCRQHPGTSYHLSTCAGPMCHVPMGFKATHLRQNPRTGNLISLALQLFCGSPTSPLRQLCEKLGCLTNRTPRTLGDVFGFIWHLNSQLFKTRPTPQTVAEMLVKALGPNKPPKVPAFMFNMLKSLSTSASQVSQATATPTGLSRSLEAMAPAIPFLYQLFMAKDSNSLPGTLFDLNQHCHTKENKSDAIVNGQKPRTIIVVHHKSGGCLQTNDLWSLYQPVGQKPSKTGDTDPYKDCRDQNCGGYLYPLTHSDGSTYDPKHASSYLSWLLYLGDDFEIGLRYMLDDFKNIDCKTSGCSGKKCSKPHQPGTHGTDAECSCDSVVYCGGVLPLLYRYGFKFYSPYSLSGDIGGIKTKRNCNACHTQLQSVVNGDPLSSFLTSIDTFLYAIRWEFFSKLSGFWSIYVCLILYTFFFLLDTLRVRSHLHFPPSNSIAPITLLSTGKAPGLRTFTKLTYFMP
ncbi:extracellular matrix-binding ebh [Babesia caballi]|uniref:Extracellular matrix-binding ebh n=1 Tax=Babesia caballi TaxID=5871 RepID=A0AAV4LWD5_BABCB|nr:extracellular matrix-binding ebh [Babesia caballi]